MRILILDDEKQYADLVADRVNTLLQARNVTHLIDVCTDSTTFLTETPVYDMAFLDVKMQPLDGIEVARRLQSVNAHIVLFMVTAYNQYLDDAMDLHVFRYLQKPLNEERLETGLQKALDQMQQKTAEIFLADRKEAVRIPLDTILYIEINGRKTNVVTTAGSFLTTRSLRAWQTALPKAFFFTVHASFIINVRAVVRYTRGEVTMQNGSVIPVAYRKQTAFRKFFLSYCQR